MIDLHCHILPGVDDGPPTFAESIGLARMLAGDGVRCVAATPHLRADHPIVVPSELAERCAQLSEEVTALGIPLEVIPAAEVDLVWALEATPEELRLASYGQRGDDLLIETPYGPLPSTFEDHLFALAIQDYRILLAHPERNPTFQKNPERLAALVHRGTLLQVTSGSLVRSPHRSRSAGLARHLMRHGLAHVIASDSHGPGCERRESLSAGLAAARDIVGPTADLLVGEAPHAVLRGQPVPTISAQRPRSRLWKR